MINDAVTRREDRGTTFSRGERKMTLSEFKDERNARLRKSSGYMDEPRRYVSSARTIEGAPNSQNRSPEESPSNPTMIHSTNRRNDLDQYRTRLLSGATTAVSNLNS